MQSSSLFFILVLLISIFHHAHSTAVPQGVYETIVPEGGIPDGCSTTYSETFNFRSLYGDVASPGFFPICSRPQQLQIRVTNGVMVDQAGRIGAVVSNRQIQFDGPPSQAGSIYTGGWSICDDGTLALGPQKKFWSCSSGTFSNLYDQQIASYCKEVIFQIMPISDC